MSSAIRVGITPRDCFMYRDCPEGILTWVYYQNMEILSYQCYCPLLISTCLDTHIKHNPTLCLVGVVAGDEYFIDLAVDRHCLSIHQLRSSCHSCRSKHSISSSISILALCRSHLLESRQPKLIDNPNQLALSPRVIIPLPRK